MALTATFRDRVARQQFDRLARRLGGMARGIDRGWPERRFAFGYRRDLWLDRGLGVDMIDTTASWSDLPALHRAVSDALDQAMRDNAARDGARGVVLAHAAHGRSDGASLNFVILYARKLDSEMEQVLAIRHAGMTAIAAQGAAFTHCHGVGEDHLAWMPQDGAQIAVLRGIKQALDPSGIMNPGKLIS